MLSTVATNLQGGYWDLDNVRLASILEPVLLDPVCTNGQFQFTLRSEPGLRFEILSSDQPDPADFQLDQPGLLDEHAQAARPSPTKRRARRNGFIGRASCLRPAPEQSET